MRGEVVQQAREGEWALVAAHGVHYISRFDGVVAHESTIGVRFHCGLMLKFHLKERNTVVLSEINFEHFCGDPKLDLGSDTNCCPQN